MRIFVLIVVFRKNKLCWELITFFFFFFFFGDIYEYPLFKQAFYLSCGKKIIYDGYSDMSMYINRITADEMQLNLFDTNGAAKKLYASIFPKSESIKEHIGKILDKDELNETDITLKEAQAITHWVFRTYNTIEERREAVPAFLNAFLQAFDDFQTEDDKDRFQHIKIAIASDVAYIEEDIEIKVVTSISGFYKELQGFPKKEVQYFYRGQSNASYLLEPSIMRTQSWFENENKMYHEIIINAWKNFESVDSHLDFLVEMQHYGLPTRLLDITGNPLVALFFACDGSTENAGEIIVFQQKNEAIKYPNSDTVSVLSCLPLFSFHKQSELKKMALLYNDNITKFNNQECVQLLLHEIKAKNPAFRNEINPKHILDCFLILSIKKNERIISQDGSFIICGLMENTSALNNLRYTCNKKQCIFIVPSDSKKKIKKELDIYKINQATMFPEITNLAGYIKDKY